MLHRRAGLSRTGIHSIDPFMNEPTAPTVTSVVGFSRRIDESPPRPTDLPDPRDTVWLVTVVAGRECTGGAESWR